MTKHIVRGNLGQQEQDEAVQVGLKVNIALNAYNKNVAAFNNLDGKGGAMPTISEATIQGVVADAIKSKVTER